jgi:hypothetical protein
MDECRNAQTRSDTRVARVGLLTTPRLCLQKASATIMPSHPCNIDPPNTRLACISMTTTTVHECSTSIGGQPRGSSSERTAGTRNAQSPHSTWIGSVREGERLECRGMGSVHICPSQGAHECRALTSAGSVSSTSVSSDQSFSGPSGPLRRAVTHTHTHTRAHTHTHTEEQNEFCVAPCACFSTSRQCCGH